MKISKINLYEVIVPAKKGTIDSAEINKPLHKLSVGADEGWSIQFDKLSKILISIELSKFIFLMISILFPIFMPTSSK